MHRAVPALVGVLVATLLSSCTDGADAGPDGSADSSSGPATTATAPSQTTPTSTGSSTRPPPEPPTMPALAQEKSTAGAKAFVKYYIDVLNYSSQSNRVALLRGLSTQHCGLCAELAEAIRDWAAQGGWQRGGEWLVTGFAVIPGQPIQRPILVPAIRVEAGTWRKSAHDRVRRIRPHQIHYEFFPVWRSEKWLMTRITP